MTGDVCVSFYYRPYDNRHIATLELAWKRAYRTNVVWAANLPTGTLLSKWIHVVVDLKYSTGTVSFLLHNILRSLCSLNSCIIFLYTIWQYSRLHMI